MKKILSILTIMGFVLVFGTAYAAGGIGMEHDTFLNYIDPSSVPGYVSLETGAVTPEPKVFTARGSAPGGSGMEHDTFLNYIDPSSVPGYMNRESGAVTLGPSRVPDFVNRKSGVISPEDSWYSR